MAVTVLAGFLALASFVPLVRGESWWIRIFDFPRTQFVLLALFALGVMLLTCEVSSGSGMFVLFAVASTLYVQVPRIYPYTPLAGKEVLSASECHFDTMLSLLVANVLITNRNGDGLLDSIARYRPDVVLLLEPDAWWERKMHVLEAEYSYTMKVPLDNGYGMLLYSRLPLLGAEAKYLMRDGVPSIHTHVRLRSGALVWLHCLHPEPPSPTEADSSLPRDAELLMVGREVRGRETPTVVAGDMNDVAWSFTTRLFQHVSALLDPRKGRGMFNTFSAKSLFMRWPVDHVFHSSHFLLCDMKRLPAFGSDHFPVYVSLMVQPAARDLQRKPELGEEQRDMAEEMIARAHENNTR